MEKKKFIALLFVISIIFGFKTEKTKASIISSESIVYHVPTSVHTSYNLNTGWKFFFGDPTGASLPGFNDSAWTNVSLPHTWNDIDTYRSFISHSGGDQSEKLFGIGWYRKHFTLPQKAKGRKIFLEFDGMRQAGQFFLNGKLIGSYENGITAVGFDITNSVKFEGQDNILAVKVDNRQDYKEKNTNTPFEWNTKDFNPNFGGLNRNAKLIITDKIYQTLPLYENLKTTGIYIYPSNFDINNKTCDVNIESQVRNESGDQQSITLSVVIVNKEGHICAKLQGNTSDLVDGETEIFTANGQLSNAKFWSPQSPNLYNVYCILTVNNKIVDVQKVKTGFRETQFKGGVGTGGVYLNGKFIWLTGYAQRAANDWPGLGGAYPDWMHDFTMSLVRESNGNFIRWMHVAPQRADVAACDKYGIVEICPAGDKEMDVQGRQWDQRIEVMRTTMISYRNNPSIFFWEAGNTVLTPQQMEQMVALRKQWDPHGGRVIGTRDNDLAEANKALTPICEWYGVMIGQAPQTDKITGDEIFRGYSIARRNKAPLIEEEDFRDEAGRNIWDAYSPPHFGFKPREGDTYHWDSETFCLAAATRYESYMLNRIDNSDSAHSKWSGYASIYFTDADADGRQDSSYVLRVSGKVDGVRLPKSLFYVSRVMQNTQPDIHIIGHWNYPPNTVKTVYTAANHCDSVELFINGKLVGVANKPCNFVDHFNGNNKDFGNTGYIYAFPSIQYKAGIIKAIGITNGKIVTRDEIKTADKPKAIRLTVHMGANGLQADGSDVALIDFEIVDAKGRRCPTDEAKVDFQITGPAIWRGGFNASRLNSTNNLYLYTECGINRVAIRSTLTSGIITVTAKRKGLISATAKIESKSVNIVNGLTPIMPQRLNALKKITFVTEQK